MSTEVEQRNIQPNQNTNSQVGGPGALGSGPAQNGNQGRSDNEYANAQGGQSGPEQPQQQNLPPPPTHPDRADQNGQYGQTQDQKALGADVGRDQHDQYVRQDQNQPPRQGTTGGEHHLGGAARAAETGAAYEGGKIAHEGKRDVQYGQGTGSTSTQDSHFADQDQHHHQHTLDRRGHRSPGGKAARATEAGALYEGGKLASGGNHPGATDTQYQQGTGVGPGQHGQYANQTQGVSGGDYDAGGHTRAAGSGAAYEGGGLAHDTGGQQTSQAAGHQAGTGAYDATGNVPGTARPAGQVATGAGAGTAAAAGGATGPTHPGAGTYTAGQQPTYAGQQTAGAGTGTDTGFRGVGLASGQAHVVLGKLQQAGGAILSDDAMKAKGLERESKGVAKVDQQEAQRLEGMANARREKASGVHAGGGPAAANAGVDPTSGAHGRNL